MKLTVVRQTDLIMTTHLIEVNMVKRIRQFMDNIGYGFQKIDDDFLSLYLNEKEQCLFGKLRKSEQIHSILVAKDIRRELGENRERDLIRAALFHDIGKIVRPMNILEKSTAVMLKRLLGRKIALLERSEMIQSYLYHGERGGEILKSEKIFEDAPLFYRLVSLHHQKREMIIKQNDSERLVPYYDLLKKYDDRY